MNQTEEIKSRLDIVELIRSYIQVKAVGANFQALCPFHREKSPSFVISPDKQIWHCFGCGRGGDVLAFVMEMEGISFPEALRLLAPQAGVTLSNFEQQDFSRRNRLLDVNEWACRYFEKHLQTEAGKFFREYLSQRGLKEETIKAWRIGYAPDSWDDLLIRLKDLPKTAKHFTESEIFAAGLSVKKEGMNRYYNRFRDRLIFPICDINNNPIAFTARVNPKKENDDKSGGKYINSPQTDLYDKSRVLFGLGQAKAAIKSENLAIIVEGQMDVISCHQHGFKNVVASSGTALGQAQLLLIKRFTNNIALAFDMDNAGQMAADRGIREAMALDFNISVVTLGGGKDAAECLNKNPEEWRQAVAQAQPMMEYFLQKTLVELDSQSAVGRKEIARRVLSLAAKINSKVEQDFWIQRLAEEIGASEASLREELKALERNNNGQTTRESAVVIKDEKKPEVLGRHELLSELLLALILRQDSLISFAAAKIEPNFIKGERKIAFYNDLIIYYNKRASLDYQEFRSFLIEQGGEGENLLDRLILLGERDFYQLDEAGLKAEILKTLFELKKYYFQEQLAAIEQEMKNAEKVNNQNLIGELMDKLKEINGRLREIQNDN